MFRNLSLGVSFYMFSFNTNNSGLTKRAQSVAEMHFHVLNTFVRQNTEVFPSCVASTGTNIGVF